MCDVSIYYCCLFEAVFSTHTSLTDNDINYINSKILDKISLSPKSSSLENKKRMNKLFIYLVLFNKFSRYGRLIYDINDEFDKNVKERNEKYFSVFLLDEDKTFPRFDEELMDNIKEESDILKLKLINCITGIKEDIDLTNENESCEIMGNFKCCVYEEEISIIQENKPPTKKYLRDLLLDIIEKKKIDDIDKNFIIKIKKRFSKELLFLNNIYK